MTKKEMIEEMVNKCNINPIQRTNAIAYAMSKPKEAVQKAYDYWQHDLVSLDFATSVLTGLQIIRK